MRWTLKELLKQCRMALKKNMSKRDKWVKEWAGQVSCALCILVATVPTFDLPPTFSYCLLFSW